MSFVCFHLKLSNRRIELYCCMSLIYGENRPSLTFAPSSYCDGPPIADTAIECRDAIRFFSKGDYSAALLYGKVSFGLRASMGTSIRGSYFGGSIMESWTMGSGVGFLLSSESMLIVSGILGGLSDCSRLNILFLPDFSNSSFFFIQHGQYLLNL